MCFLDSSMYGKVVVASKVPLPNYRPDLDDKRPQREVTTYLTSYKFFEYMYLLDSRLFHGIASKILVSLYVQVVVPLSLQRRVEGLLQEHCDRVQLSSGKASEISNNAKSIDQVKDVNMDESEDSYLDGSVMEKVLQRRSLRMRNMQRAWQVISIMHHNELS